MRKLGIAFALALTGYPLRRELRRFHNQQLALQVAAVSLWLVAAAVLATML